MPIFTKQIDQGKGVVYDFDLNMEASPKDREEGPKEKLLGATIQASNMSTPIAICEERDLREALNRSRGERASPVLSTPDVQKSVKACKEKQDQSFGDYSTEYGPSSSMIRPSGVSPKPIQKRRRPHIRKRQEQKHQTSILQELYGSEEGKDQIGNKRKLEGEDSSGGKIARRNAKAILQEGSPQSP